MLIADMRSDTLDLWQPIWIRTGVTAFFLAYVSLEGVAYIYRRQKILQHNQAYNVKYHLKIGFVTKVKVAETS